MRRHLALITALALASADTEGELRLSLTYNDMAARTRRLAAS